ncbi:MAG: nucleotidyltransferase family protein, partial [Chloroflexi bacterium]|nr:nucleotidyltransferase family protein [Chloroflexota bacterium]
SFRQPKLYAKTHAFSSHLIANVQYRIAHEIRVRMLCDIGEVVRRFGAELDWQGLAARARQWGAVRAVYVILRLAQELLEVAVPGDWLVSLRPDGLSEHYLDLAREQILIERSGAKAALLGSNYLPQLWASKGLGNKLALIRDRLLPPRETMALTYPAPANSWRIYLHYPARIKDVLARRGATLWWLARGDSKTRALAEYSNQIMALRDWLMSG